ncbi:growth factor receptor-bound protein 2-like [Mizuhopecten yessoensis]|uniref:Growth factor receptor-bound protein 2 n=1 Tax=Mizuhopecten yessoensis TaxID=6573 RepID=A0A210QFX6_MIZYE|nr:growth factor receptor-bound protein 2-like [Mizuhopecten yessoensis]OWF47609.1 Growth factor receptor-bound protein 2 [Mizuhopecten yessoensis]
MEAKAIYDFEPSNDDEMGFKDKDMLLIVDLQSDENWWKALHPDNPSERFGMVPMNRVKMLPHNWYAGRISRKQAEDQLLKGNLPDGAFLLRDSESSPGDFSLSVRFKSKIQHFKILRDGSGKFFLWVVKFTSINKLIEHHKTCSVSRTETILLKDAPKDGQQTQEVQKPEKVVEKVTCLYDFNPADEEELKFSKGDILEVLEKDLDSWWKGKHTKTGQTGLFPINYVKLK